MPNQTPSTPQANSAVSPGKVVLIGVGLSREDLTARHLELIRDAQLLVGGRRHLEWFPELPAEKLPITRDLEGLLETIRREREGRRVVVLASGDPLCFGIGGRLATDIGPEHLVIFPNISALAGAFARIGEPWQEVALVSLHGREGAAELAAALTRARRVAVLTDASHSPAWVGAFLMRRGLGEARLCVLERMGAADERRRWMRPEEAAAGTFSEPNLAVVLQDHPPPELLLGLPEDRFAHEGGMITKAEVRAVTLARLRPGPRQVLWDLGAGSGAVGLEASLLMPGGQVWAVEKHPGRAAQIRENRQRFGAWCLEVVEAELPDGLAGLPDPDRVFVGGGGAGLAQILSAAASRLRPRGRIVVNTVVLERVVEAAEALRASGMEPEVVHVHISRSRPMPGGQRLEALNPVWILSGARDEGPGT
jgi:precorrin-6Y C5,15-methyltransferase (decarboxylating)